MEVHELYKLFRRDLTARALAMTRNRDRAEDLVQETFLRAMTHFEDLRPLSREQCQAWLYRTARNLYIDQTRRSSREVQQSAELLEQSHYHYEEDLTRSAVAQLVGRLPESERVIFILRHFEGYNARELGEMFSLPPATVRSRLASARRRLRKWMED